MGAVEMGLVREPRGSEMVLPTAIVLGLEGKLESVVEFKLGVVTK